MSGPIKDFVVRGRDANGRRVYAYPDEENGYEPKRGTGKLLISSEDAACFARLELQAAGCTDVAIYQVHDDGREERLPSYEEALTLLGADPLAALEAAERRLLEAGGWREDSPGWWNDGLTGVSTISTERRSVALTIERRRLAAKGGA